VAFTFIVMGMTYVFRSPQFHCQYPNGEIKPCSQQEACMHLVLGDWNVTVTYPEIQYSIVEEFELICAREYLVAYSQSLFFFGGLISGYILNYLSDRIGRRYLATYAGRC
jgi:hypothetical protein